MNDFVWGGWGGSDNSTSPTHEPQHPQGFLGSPNADYPTFNYDFQPYNIDNGPDPEPSPWSDPELQSWVDLESTN